MLLLSGATRFAGEVDAGDTVMDFLEQERERGARRAPAPEEAGDAVRRRGLHVAWGME